MGEADIHLHTWYRSSAYCRTPATTMKKVTRWSLGTIPLVHVSQSSRNRVRVQCRSDAKITRKYQYNIVLTTALSTRYRGIEGTRYRTTYNITALCGVMKQLPGSSNPGDSMRPPSSWCALQCVGRVPGYRTVLPPRSSSTPSRHFLKSRTLAGPLSHPCLFVLPALP